MTNTTVDKAVETMATVNPAASAQLAAGAPQIPAGVATTAAALTLGGMLGRVAPEFQSREMGGMMRLASTMMLFSALQGALPAFAGVFSGMGSAVFGGFNQSAAVISMSNAPGSPLAANFAASFGNQNTIMKGMDAESGTTTVFGAQPVSVQSAPALQQNTLAAVPGASGPGMTPPGMG